MLEDVVYSNSNIKILVTKHIFKFIENTYPHLIKSCILIDQASQEFIDTQSSTSWDESEISLWCSLMTGGDICIPYISMLEACYNQWNFDAICYWGSNAAVKKFAQKYNIPSLAFELGCTRNPYFDSIIIDPLGSNGDASPATFNIETIAKLLEYPENLYSTKNIEQYSQLIDTPTVNPLLVNQIELIHNCNGTVFIPLQLHDDANLLIFSPYRSMLEFLQHVLPDLLNNNMFIIIKNHPAAASRPGGSAISTQIRNYLSQFQNILFIDEHTDVKNHEIINLSNVVITVNSSVGFEATLHRKPVIIMGDACYKVQDVFPTIRSYFIDNTFDYQKYVAHLRIISHYFHSMILLDKSSIFTAKYFNAIVLGMIDSWNNSHGNLKTYLSNTVITQPILRQLYDEEISNNHLISYVRKRIFNTRTKTRLGHFFYQSKTTSKNKRIIKVCRIPVYKGNAV